MKYHLLPALLWLVVGNFLAGNPFVGEWRSTSIKDPEGNGPKVGWEIQFTEDMQYHKLSDEGFNIQMESSGRYSFDEECLQLYWGASDRSQELDYTFKDNLLIIQWGWKDKVEVTLERSKEPLAALHELPTVPRSLDEAADLLVSEMSDHDKEYVRSLPADQLIQFHMGFGMGIRNRFRLWSGNSELLESCGGKDMHPDNASGVIIGAVWDKLQKQREDYPEFLSLNEKYTSLLFPAVPLRNLKLKEMVDQVNEAIDVELKSKQLDPDSMNLILEKPKFISKRKLKKYRLNTLPFLKVWGQKRTEKANLRAYSRGFQVVLRTPNDVIFTPQSDRFFTVEKEQHHYASVAYRDDLFDMATEVSDSRGLSIYPPGVYRSSYWTMRGQDGALEVDQVVQLFRGNSNYSDAESVMEIHWRWYEAEGEAYNEYRVASLVKPEGHYKQARFQDTGHIDIKDGPNLSSLTNVHNFEGDPEWKDSSLSAPISFSSAMDALVTYLEENHGPVSPCTFRDIIFRRLAFTDNWLIEIRMRGFGENSKFGFVKGFVTLDGKLIPYVED